MADKRFFFSNIQLEMSKEETDILVFKDEILHFAETWGTVTHRHN